MLKGGLSPIWFISRKMTKQDFVYHCWQWLAVTLNWLLHMLWISHHYEPFTECRNEDSVAKIDTNSIFMIWGLNPLLALYSSIIFVTLYYRPLVKSALDQFCVFTLYGTAVMWALWLHNNKRKMLKLPDVTPKAQNVLMQKHDSARRWAVENL